MTVDQPQVADLGIPLELHVVEKKALLVGRDAFFVLNLRLHHVEGVTRLDVQRDCLPIPRERHHEELHRFEAIR